MSILSLDTRHAKTRDVFGITAVHDASWRHAYTGIIPHKALDMMIQRRDPKWWARAIRQSTRVLVMQVDGQIVGYATVGRNRVPDLPQEGEVYELYLRPEYQGIGLGKKLFLAARQELVALGLKGCVVWTLEDNSPALDFYKNAGGKDIAEGYETFNEKTLNKIAFVWE